MLLFGSNQISKGSEFQMEGATTENARLVGFRVKPSLKQVHLGYCP